MNTHIQRASEGTKILRRFEDRGSVNLGWLDGRHTFSFGEFHDPAWMGFHALRVLNDDRIAPGGGFGMHPHRDMEIISVVLSGTLRHQDSMGNSRDLTAGEVQVMSAGTGVRHSERNASPDTPVHLLQIWILPEKTGFTPAYDQRDFLAGAEANTLVRVAGKDVSTGDRALHIHQSADVYLVGLTRGGSVSIPILHDQSAWVHAATGTVDADGFALRAGDALGVEGAPIDIKGEGVVLAVVMKTR